MSNGYNSNRETDPALHIIKLYEAALFYANRAIQTQNGNEYLSLVIKTEKAMHKIRKIKLPMIPQHAPLNSYFNELLLMAESGDRSKLPEFVNHITELRNTWIEARKRFKNKSFK